MKNISCIIPAYNEAGRITSVLNAVVPLIGNGLIEVIVINDGSTDKTARDVMQFPLVRLISKDHNEGKSSAIATGIKAAKGDIILLLDADLTGLTSEDIRALLSPIQTRTADVAISLRGNAPFIARLISLNYISGERVFPRAMVTPTLATMRRVPNLGLEVFLNRIIIAHNYRIASVPWKDVHNTGKIYKRGVIQGVMLEITMLFDMFHVIPPWDVFEQNRRMHHLLTVTHKTRNPAQRL